jgi:hypothetical protein
MERDRNTYGIIYVIFSLHPKCSKVYVGQTSQPDPSSRFSDHINDAYRKGKKEFDYKISRAIRKYGKITWKILTIDKYLNFLKISKNSHQIKNPQLYTSKKPNFKAKSQIELDQLEILWIAELNSYHNGYNSTLGGGGRRFVEGFLKVQISHFKDLLKQGFLKSNILVGPHNPFENISQNQFDLRLAYTDLTEQELVELHNDEVSARFFNNYKRQQALANIIEIELTMGINHFENIEYNKSSISQSQSIQDIKKITHTKKNLAIDIDKILELYGVNKELRANLKPNHSLSLGRIGDIRGSIIIDLFENDRIFSQDYLKEKYKSTRDIIRSSPVQRGYKRIYGNLFHVVHNWKIISIGDECVFSTNKTKKLNKTKLKKWKNYTQFVFIENLLINTPFISPKQLAELYFGKNYSETQRKDFSRKLNLIKKLAESNKRFSEFYLNKEIILTE